MSNLKLNQIHQIADISLTKPLYFQQSQARLLSYGQQRYISLDYEIEKNDKNSFQISKSALEMWQDMDEKYLLQYNTHTKIISQRK